MFKFFDGLVAARMMDLDTNRAKTAARKPSRSAK